jgi:type II secretory pathway pseudopilin PulG
MRARHAHQAPRRSFTLVELVVVIGIVVLLSGLLFSVGSAVIERSERSRTEGALTLLGAALKTWELEAQRTLTWWDAYDLNIPREPFDVHGDTPEQLILTEILRVVEPVPRVGEVLARIDPELVVRLTPGAMPSWIDEPAEQQLLSAWQARGPSAPMAVLDAWGTPVYATHPGRPWASGDEAYSRDDDGTIRTDNERRYGACRNRQAVFVSAGPDRRFGLPEEFPPDATEQDLAAARRDNMYSGPVAFPQY